MSHYHAVVWIDHREAKVFHFNPTTSRSWSCIRTIRPSTCTTRRGRSAAAMRRRTRAFSMPWPNSIADAGAVLITGPSDAKNELVKHIDKHDPKLMKLIAGVETVDHPSDGQLVAHARHYLAGTDRMRP